MRKLLLILLLIPTLTQAFFCPSNFSQINMGDSLDKILQQCGKPATQVDSSKEVATAQEWDYYIPQSVQDNSGGQVTGTLKTSFTFDANGKAINISVNGIGVGSTTVCGNNVQLGDSPETVKKACGEASFINKQQSSAGLGGGTPHIKVTELTYDSNPPVTLVFEGGVLVRTK
jgi:hypothetical protein